MNILIASAGRRTKLVEYFMHEFNHDGKVIVTDCDNLAPTMHIGAKGYIVPKITDDNYVDELLKICKEEEYRCNIIINRSRIKYISKRKIKI